MEIEIRADQVAGAMLEAVHAAIGLVDSVDRRARVRGSRQSRRGRLDHLPQHEQFVDELFARRCLQVPCQHLGIEQIPIRFRTHPGADLWARDDQRLRAEDTVRLAQGGAGHRETGAHLLGVRQQGPGRVDPGHDLLTESRGQLAVDVALESGIVTPLPSRATQKRAAGRRARPQHRAGRRFSDARHDLSPQLVFPNRNEPTRDLCITMKMNRRIPPLIMIHAPFSDPLKLMSVAIRPKIIPPNSVPATVPTPPVNMVPPSTTEAMAVSSLPVPARGYP